MKEEIGMSEKRKIGMWLYRNGGGDVIGEKIIRKLNERDISVINNINLGNARVQNENIIDLKTKTKLNKLDLFFSYNAGEQTSYQVYLYQTLNYIIPMLNSYESFRLTEDKFQTSFVLRHAGLKTVDSTLFHSDNSKELKKLIQKWEKIVYKPTGGWGGTGLMKLDSEEDLNKLMLLINQMSVSHLFIEKFIKYDNTDYRIDIVDGKFAGCYGRKAADNDWRTNITSGGRVFLREPNDEVIDIAIKASSVCGSDIAGVDIIYDQEQEEYVVLEVNGISAFATPEQEKIGINFNDKKIDLIVDLIDKKTKKYFI